MSITPRYRHARAMVTRAISGHRHADVPPELEWCIACGVFAVAPARNRYGYPAIEVKVLLAENLHHVPRQLKLPNWRESIPLIARVGCIPVAQAGSQGCGLSIYNATRADAQSHGTICALVRDREDPSRIGVLTAAHVMAAAPDTQIWDTACIGYGNGMSARLRHWWPTYATSGQDGVLDAALLDVDIDTARQLSQAIPIPDDYSGYLAEGMEVTTYGSTGQEPVTGIIKSEEDTWVQLARTDGRLPEYKLLSAIRYDAKTLGGDSGAPVFNQRHELVGMHCAENVFWRITRVLDEKIGFGLDLITRNAPVG